MIRPSSYYDFLSIVNAWYPELERLADKLIETFARVNQLTGFHFGLNLPSNSNGRFSLRDLLKWCRRIVNLGFFFGGDMSTSMCSSIYHVATRKISFVPLLTMNLKEAIHGDWLEWEIWARNELMITGSELQGKFSNLQVTLLWMTVFWFVGYWLVPMGAWMMGFNKATSTFRGQAFLSLLTYLMEGFAGAAILYHCLYRL